jgi:hypothetical protein
VWQRSREIEGLKHTTATSDDRRLIPPLARNIKEFVKDDVPILRKIGISYSTNVSF